MVFPMFEDDYKNMSLKELMKVRQKLLIDIQDFENGYILNQEKIYHDVIVSPTPETVYSIDNDNLIMLTRLIKRKLNNIYEEDEEDDDIEYYFLTVTYSDSDKEYNYLAEDTSIKVGDKVIVERRNENTIATVVDASFYNEWDAPYPVEETKYIIEKVVEKELDEVEILKENIDIIKYDEIIAVTVAEGGAMGEPNGFYAVTEDLKVYHTNFATSEIPFNELKTKFTILEKLNCGMSTIFSIENGWKWFNLGFGNYLMIREKYGDVFEKYTKALIGNDYRPSTLYVLWFHILKKIIIK